jgi:hypothetical protein
MDWRSGETTKQYCNRVISESRDEIKRCEFILAVEPLLLQLPDVNSDHVADLMITGSISYIPSDSKEYGYLFWKENVSAYVRKHWSEDEYPPGLKELIT